MNVMNSATAAAPMSQPRLLTTTMNSPYRGLIPYTEADAAYFFGRQREIATITANLEVARLTLFYGPSGVGKTSVLRAGVLHSLMKQAQTNLEMDGCPEIIPVYFNRWYDSPLLLLTEQIDQVALQLYQGRSDVPDVLAESQPSFGTVVAKLGEQTQSDLLLILDQFEEYFLYTNSPGTDDFAQAFIYAVNSPGLRVNFLLSLREDTLAQIDHFKGSIPFLVDNRLTMQRLSRANAQKAIEEPLARYSMETGQFYTIEQELTATILDQLVESRNESLRQRQNIGSHHIDNSEREQIETPYLQLVLSRLWAEEQTVESMCLRLETLTRLEGTTTIVSNYLDDTMMKLSEDEQTLAAHCFERLVTPSGNKVALSLHDLVRFADANEAKIVTLLQKLLRQRILQDVASSQGEALYEITHDVLGQAILTWQERYFADIAEAERLAEAQAEIERLAAEQAEAERIEARRLETERIIREIEARAALQEKARRQAQDRAAAEAERAESEARRVRQSRWALAALSLLLFLLVAAIGLSIRAQRDAEANAIATIAVTLTTMADQNLSYSRAAEATIVAYHELAENLNVRALQLLEQGKLLAAQGAVTEATMLLQQAVALDPMLQIEPIELANQVLADQVQMLLLSGYELAHQGDFEEATNKLGEASKLDSTLNFDALIEKAKLLTAEAHLDEGRELAREGKLDEALFRFAQATTLDMTLDQTTLTTEAIISAIAAGITDTETPVLSTIPTVAFWHHILRLVESVADPVLASYLCQLRTQIPILVADEACERMIAWAPVLVSDVVVTGTVETTTGDLWQFTLAEPATVTITLAADNSDLDTYLTLYDSQFMEIMANDDSGDSRDSALNDLPLTGPGIYLIEARGYSGDTGAYRLLVTVGRVE